MAERTAGSNHLAVAMPIMSIANAVERRKAIVRFTKSIMVADVDYGTIPGTAGKATLLKPGAEKLATFFGLSVRYEILDKITDWTGESHHKEPFFYFQYKCQLYRDGVIVGEGIGSCNSWEKKYRYRKGERVCPECGKPAIIKGKKEFGGGWLCFGKKGGCGSKWADGDAVIEGQNTDQVPNDNPADLVNTVDKMSQKRSLVSAVLIAVNASEFFTQDMGDDDDNVIDINGVDVSSDVEASYDIPDMASAAPVSQGKATNPSEKQLGMLRGELKRLGIKDGDKRRLITHIYGENFTSSQCSKLISMLKSAETLPKDVFRHYVKMLSIDHPWYDALALQTEWKKMFGDTPAELLTLAQQGEYIDWLLMTPEDEPTVDGESKALVEASDDVLDLSAVMLEPPSPWLAEITRIQNETKESLEEIEAWLLRVFGRGSYNTVEEMPVEWIEAVQKMDASAIKTSMDGATLV